MELCLEAYFGLIEDCKDHPEWIRKIEEDIGQNMAFMFINFDESVRDNLVAESDLFQRFDLEKQKFFKWLKATCRQNDYIKSEIYTSFFI